MAKRKKRRLKKSVKKFLRMSLISAFLIAGIICLGGKSLREVATTLSLKKELSECDDSVAKLQGEKEDLESTKEKLSDDNYVANLARGKYSFFKDGEQIYYFPPLEN